MKTKSIVLALATGLLMTACASGGQPAEDMAMSSDGARIWRMTCARCHNARPALEFDARQWPVIVSHMRTHADLSRSDADAVAAFLSAAAAEATSMNTHP